jgi:radical SAM superfamily enzyme YgiQ (UPF0313 family)
MTDSFEALVKETNWSTVSIGFESGSDRVLKILNKECTAEDNDVTIDLLNRIGDELQSQGRQAPKFWANIMLGIPGETHEDAFDTMRMLKRMKRVLPSISLRAIPRLCPGLSVDCRRQELDEQGKLSPLS